MEHISDYVSWRGDLSFSERGFTTEDNLVLSELVYIDYKPVMEGQGQKLLKDAIYELDKEGILKNTRAGSGSEDEDFARICGRSARFGNIIIEDFEDIFDSTDRQFAAITYRLDDGTMVIGFRGTDATIIGWKEDFMISYTKVPSQDLALEYARIHVKDADGDVILLGHSKGAHLALYAGAHLERQEQDKLKKVYINDGPGFCDAVLDKSLIYNIISKIVKVTPEYSIIGRIFETPAGQNFIVRSSATAILQHNISSWCLDANGIVCCDDHAPESHLLNDVFDRFVEGMDLEARENFIETLFGSMMDTGATTIMEFASQGPSAFEDILINMLGKDAFNLKNKVTEIKKEDNSYRNIFVRIWGLLNRKESIRIGATLLLSALCFAFPDFAMESVVFAIFLFICIYETVLTIRHLRESGWDFKKERPRVVICMSLLVITSAILVKESALFVISSMLLGFFFLVLSYQNVINYKLNNTKMFERFRYSFEGIITFLLGGYIMVVPDIENSWYMMSCGSLLMVDAIFEALKLLRDTRMKK